MVSQSLTYEIVSVPQKCLHTILGFRDAKCTWVKGVKCQHACNFSLFTNVNK